MDLPRIDELVGPVAAGFENHDERIMTFVRSLTASSHEHWRISLDRETAEVVSADGTFLRPFPVHLRDQLVTARQQQFERLFSTMQIPLDFASAEYRSSRGMAWVPP